MQQNLGKITIHQEKENGNELSWGDMLCEKEYQYYGEAKEALETITWKEAEELCHQKLDATFAILIKAWKKQGENWIFTEERTLLLFVKQEQESVKENKK